jgi:hypothetical protein
MRRKLTTLRAKQGHSQNGAPRQLIDEATYLEMAAYRIYHAQPLDNFGRFDSEYSGLSNPSRPRDQAISLRRTVHNN